MEMRAPRLGGDNLGALLLLALLLLLFLSCRRTRLVSFLLSFSRSLRLCESARINNKKFEINFISCLFVLLGSLALSYHLEKCTCKYTDTNANTHAHMLAREEANEETKLNWPAELEITCT